MGSINLNEIHKFLLEIVPRCGDVNFYLMNLKPFILLFTFNLDYSKCFLSKERNAREKLFCRYCYRN